MAPDYFRRLARYNEWANARLYQACRQIGQEEAAARRPSFFGSILNTLNHILVADRLWLARIEGRREEGITALNQILHSDLADLSAARQEFDRRIIDAIDGIDEARLAGDLHYQTMAGQQVVTPLHFVLGHMFNHATHHRGQVHDMLSQTQAEPPPLDLIYFLRD